MRDWIINRSLGYAVAFLGAVTTGGSLQAADLPALMSPGAKPLTTQSGWTFTVAPYFWAADLSGNIAILGAPEIHVDPNFSQIWDHLDFAIMVAGEARYENFTIFGDAIYLKLSNEAQTPRGIVASSVEVDAKSFAGLLGGGYSVINGAAGNLDVVAGARLWSVDTDISFNGGLVGGLSLSDGATWVDALAGVKGNYFFTPNLYLTGWGLVGGGGADLDWDVMGGLGYKFNNRISAIAGYRALGVDYRQDGFVFDVVQQGPILGVAFQF